MRAPKVVVGWHDFGDTKGAFTMALANMCLYSGRMIHGLIREPGPYVTQSRNHIVDKFLKSSAEYLLMVDGDEEFPPDSLYRTLAAYQTNGADVLYGNYALADGASSFFVMYPDVDIPQNADKVVDLEACRAYKIAAAATGWLFAHRSVFEAMREKFQPIDPWPWFNHDLASTRNTEDETWLLKDLDGNIRLGEDITFCQRARSMGMNLIGYTGVLITHHKVQALLCEFMTDFAKEAGLDV